MKIHSITPKKVEKVYTQMKLNLHFPKRKPKQTQLTFHFPKTDKTQNPNKLDKLA